MSGTHILCWKVNNNQGIGMKPNRNAEKILMLITTKLNDCYMMTAWLLLKM